MKLEDPMERAAVVVVAADDDGSLSFGNFLRLRRRCCLRVHVRLAYA